MLALQHVVHLHGQSNALCTFYRKVSLQGMQAYISSGIAMIGC